MNLMDALTRFFQRRFFFTARGDLPHRIELPALSETWMVEYRPTSRRSVMARSQQSGRLVVSGWVSDGERCRAALRRWLMRHASAHLLPRLAELSAQTGWHYRAASVRNQHARWGSCSTTGHISLNCKLLFLPDPLVRMVMLHELCHLVEPNHSKRFWARLREMEPDTNRLHGQIREAGKTLPVWVNRISATG